VNRWRPLSSKRLRRELRANQTDAEHRLWRRLGSVGLGIKFRRQHSIGPYVVDFYCPAARLAIEVDGDGHTTTARAAHDDQRSTYLSGFGIRVIRFSDHDVLKRIDDVLEDIARTLTLPSPVSTGEGCE
jgi:very-short-patch-repair endonuclease